MTANPRSAPLVVAVLAVALAFAAALAPGAAAEEATAGGRCVSDCECPPGELCEPPDGTCQPAICPRDFRPVCGLDGRTYSNACEARAAHVVIAHEGECGEVCGGIQGKACPHGKICDLPAGSCRAADVQGLCVEQPQVCPQIYDPVCGCDGRTYANDCLRLAAGAQIDHRGPCEDATGEAAECRRNAECGRGEYCNSRPGACGQSGVCRTRPEACPEIFDPVCGCDGVTYSNACFAAAAGQSVRCDDPCSRCLRGY